MSIDAATEDDTAPTRERYHSPVRSWDAFQSQRALHFVAQRVARVRWGGDLRLSRERERELHGVSRPGALDEHVDPAVRERPGARAVALEGPGSGRRREAHRDGVLAPA